MHFLVSGVPGELLTLMVYCMGSGTLMTWKSGILANDCSLSHPCLPLSYNAIPDHSQCVII